MSYVLVFNKPVDLRGLRYPAGSLVPAGAFDGPKLRTLKRQNWVIELSEDAVGEAPKPVRLDRLDRNVVEAAREHLARKQAETKQAKDQLTELETRLAESEAPVDDYEPERIADDGELLARRETVEESEEPEESDSKRRRSVGTKVPEHTKS